jgi:hypothetical protein
VYECCKVPVAGYPFCPEHGGDPIFMAAEETPHRHHHHPSRCCPEEPAQDVLQRLQASPPERLGYPTVNGWSGESEEEFASRQRAWRDAVKREEGLLIR